MIILSIIVVSYNTRLLLKSCLQSILDNSTSDLKKQLEIIVVDNASTDGTIEMLKKEFPGINVIGNRENRGYAKANNQGLSVAKGEYRLLLNSDTILSPQTLEKTLECCTKNPNIGVLGCRLLNEDKSIQQSAGYLPNLLNVFLWLTFIDDLPLLNKIIRAYHLSNKSFYEKSKFVGWVSGAYFLLRGNIINMAGDLDENIFMYGEEVEWCLRISQAGWKIYFYSGAQVTHLKGKSGKGEHAGIEEEFVALEYIFRKHKSYWQLLILRLLLKLGALLRILIFGIILQDKKRLNIYAKVLKMA